MTESDFRQLAASGYNRVPLVLETFADLDTHAGHSVRLTGQMTGNSIAVSKIGAPKVGKKSK